MSARSLRPALMLIAAAAVAGAALWVALRPKPVPVDLVTVDHGPLVVTVDEEGYTRVRDLYVVSAPIAGHLLRIQRRAGDPVRAGETVLAEILPTAPAFNDRRTQAELQARARTAEAALSLARADVTRAKAQLAFARDEFSRADRLAAQGTVPQSTRDKAETEMRTRQAELDSARAQLKVRAFELETAKAALIEPGDDSAVANSDTCCVHIQAPVDGRVLRLIAESEQVVAAGQALLEVGDPRALEVVVELLSEDAVGVRPGARATIEDWGGPPLAATVRRIEPYGFTKVSALGVEEQRVRVILDFAAPPPEGADLGHGFRVDARIVTWETADTLRVPESALFRDGGQTGPDWTVYRVDADGVASRRAVTAGRRNGQSAQVLDGLAAGDRVVAYPSDRVTDGAVVTAGPE